MKNEKTLPPEVLAALVEAAMPVEPPEGLKGKIMARAGFSMPAHHAITIMDDQGWIPVSDLLQIKLLFVDEKADSVSLLLKGKAGASVPPHKHSRYEECLVLQGDVEVGDLKMGPGDFHCVSTGIDHPEIFTRHGALVYLRTAIADCPIPLR
ncbi:MAG: hypothetical protein V4603_01660 [Pseudomonadota bacterium]